MAPWSRCLCSQPGIRQIRPVVTEVGLYWIVSNKDTGPRRLAGRGSTTEGPDRRAPRREPCVSCRSRQPTDAELVRIALMQSGLDCEIRLSPPVTANTWQPSARCSRPHPLRQPWYDFEGLMVLRQVRLRFPDVPFLFLFLFLSGFIFLARDTAASIGGGRRGTACSRTTWMPWHPASVGALERRR